MSLPAIPHRIKYLDGLKAIAILGIVLRHYSSFYPSLESVSGTPFHIFVTVTPIRILYNGPFWVYVYWFISAYLIGYKYFTTGKNPRVIPGALKRYIRLVFPVIVTTFISYILLRYSLIQGTNPTPVVNYIFWIKPSFSDMAYQALIRTFFFSNNEYVISLWFVTVGFLGSIFISIFVSLVGKKQLRYILYLFLFIPAIQFQYIAILLGFVFSDLHVHVDAISKKIVSPLVSWTVLVLGIIFASYPIGNLLMELHSRYGLVLISSETLSSAIFHSLGLIGIFTAILHLTKLQRILSGKLITFIGKLSYSVACVHIVVFYAVSNRLFTLLLLHYNYHFAFISMFIVSMIITFPLSYLLYRYIEIPGITLSNRLYTYLNTKL